MKCIKLVQGIREKGLEDQGRKNAKWAGCWTKKIKTQTIGWTNIGRLEQWIMIDDGKMEQRTKTSERKKERTQSLRKNETRTIKYNERLSRNGWWTPTDNDKTIKLKHYL